MRAMGLPAWIIVALWFGLALTYAILRVPYDDEWFSIEVARTTDPALFLQALASDVHPPWVAYLDRALLGAGLPRWTLNLWRLLCAAGGLWLLLPLWQQRAKVPGWLVALCAFHPIVFMYAGAIRWYPLLLLAHGLRASAIWSPGTSRAGRNARFLMGAVLGSVAGYIDGLLLVHDSAWLLASQRGQTQGKRGRLVTAALSLFTPVVLMLLSPLGTAHLERLTMGTTQDGPGGMITWAMLGMLGEAAPPYPAMLFGLFIVAACGLGLYHLHRDPERQQWARWVSSLAGVWLLASLLGVWHPRYSLALWPAVGALIYVAAMGGLTGRWLARFSAGYLTAVLLIGIGGRGFFKADLNALQRRDCETIGAEPAPQVVVVPYPRLAELVELTCPQLPKPVRVPPAFAVKEPGEQVAELRRAMVGHEHITLLVNAKAGSRTPTEANVRDWLLSAGRCQPVDVAPFGLIPHLIVKQLIRGDTQERRFVRERYRCYFDG